MTWFNGPTPSTTLETEFVQALRAAAAAGAFPGVDPDDTVAGALTDPPGRGVTVGLAIPRLTTDRRWLLVSYQPGAEGGGTPVLQSGWSSVLMLTTEPGAYDGPQDELDLWVSGIAASPDACAEWVLEWFQRQLQRPVTRREWDQPASGPGAGLFRRQRVAAAVEWWLSEPEQYLDSRGTFGRGRLTRQPPSREVHERP